jgi:UDP:flavonoid glycosyltransferase YjiC (YdhE family)
MDIWPIRPVPGRIGPKDRIPPQFLELPEAPLVYVTLGTVFNDPDLVRSMLDAIQDLPISIAITTGPGTDPALLGRRPANVAAASFVPQALLLPLASAVVSHTGSGTMLGALASGLPQVCLPRGADQFANAERVHPSVRASGCCPMTSPRIGSASLCRRFSTTPPTRELPLR